MEYDHIKLLHIVSSTILFGTGLGSAFYLFMANRQRNVAAIYFATRNVVIADWVFTTPAIIVQLITGLWLQHEANFAFDEAWIHWALTLFGLIGACWIPVVWMQTKMRNMAKVALDSGAELPARYWKLDRWWTILGSLAFPAVLVIFYLMVMKP